MQDGDNDTGLPRRDDARRGPHSSGRIDAATGRPQKMAHIELDKISYVEGEGERDGQLDKRIGDRDIG